MDNRRRSKIKNEKIQGWRLELANFYNIRYRLECYNVVADALGGAYSNASFVPSLKKLHDNLCQPEITRILYNVRSKNIAMSTEEVKKACSSCKICAELKPRFASLPKVNLI